MDFVTLIMIMIKIITSVAHDMCSFFAHATFAWCNQRQTCITTITKSKFIVANKAIKEPIWFRQLLSSSGVS
jgi:hypothetical protein